jgi:hypothetical protein
MIKTEEEIRAEIEATKRTMENYRNAHKNGQIPMEVLSKQIVDCYATIDALRWVLGENDRYD